MFVDELSAACYVLLYFLVKVNSKGPMSFAIQIMVLVIIPVQVLHGVLLFLGALEEKTLALEIALWLCLILATYNTILGCMGGIYFIPSAYLTVHLLLVIIFALMALSLFSVLCHDILMIHAYKVALQSDSPDDIPDSTATRWVAKVT